MKKIVFIPYQKSHFGFMWQVGSVYGQINYPKYWRTLGIGYIKRDPK